MTEQEIHINMKQANMVIMLAICISGMSIMTSFFIIDNSNSSMRIIPLQEILNRIPLPLLIATPIILFVYYRVLKFFDKQKFINTNVLDVTNEQKEIREETARTTNKED